MNIGLFGGTFDPFHKGHCAIIKGALKSGFVDAVIVIPSARSPFKNGSCMTAAPYRYYMTLHAVEDEFKGEDVFVSDIEFSYKGLSYTVTTIEEISNKSYISNFLSSHGVSEKKAAGEHKFFWICGSDVIPTFNKWHEYERIFALADLLIAKRPGDDSDIDAFRNSLALDLGKEPGVHEFHIEGVDVSSSEIKASGKLKGVPKSVKDFIKTHALYETPDPMSFVSPDTARTFLENAVTLYGYLGEKRLLHTLNVGILSAKYAYLYDKSLCDNALIAGQLHDCAKELDDNGQKEMARERSGDLFEDKKLWHSPAGAVMAENVFGVKDEDILDAITYHTTGRGDMTLLDKIVYLADKLEPSRTYADLSKQRSLALDGDMDEALRMCVKSVERKFKDRGQEIHPLTVDFMGDLGL